MTHLRRFAFLFVVIILLSGFQTAKQETRPEPVVRGVVLDPEGRPVEGAVVVVSAMASGIVILRGDVPLTARTDAQGRFSVPLTRPSTQTVRVVAEGLAPWMERRVPPGSNLSITLARGSSVKGLVLDGRTRKPVAGARVEVESRETRGASVPSLPGLGILRAETDENGFFQVDGLGQGPYAVSAGAKGYGRAQKSDVKPGETMELFLFPGSSIVGTVLDENEKPVEGAIVQVESDSPLVPQIAGAGERSNARGDFEILGVAPGSYRLAVRHPNFAPAIVPKVQVGREEEVGLDVFLSRGAPVQGRLVDAEGRPVSGRVRLESLDGERVSSVFSDLFAAAGRDGLFHLPALPPGAHVLQAEAPAFSPRKLDVEIGDRQERVDLGDVSLEQGLAIQGRVIGAGGEPISGARLMASKSGPARMMWGEPSNLEAISTEDGTFLVGGLGEGAYSLSILAEGYGRKILQSVEAATEGLTVVLEAGGSIRGAVVDDQGRPVETFRVMARAHDRTHSGFDSVADPEGRFTLRDLNADTYVLEISAPDHVSAAVSDVKVIAGKETDVGKVRVATGGRVQGYVFDAGGAPVPGATVTASSAVSRWSMTGNQAVTDAEGFFSLTGVPEGLVDLAARHPDYGDGSLTGLKVDARSGPTAARIVLSKGGNVEGWVRSRDGIGIEGRIVWYFDRESMTLRSFREDMVKTDSDGHFVLERLPAGRGQVQIMTESAPGMLVGLQTRDVEIREGETTSVDFFSRQVLVQGRVTRGGAPVPGLSVVFHPSRGGGVTYSVGFSGTRTAASSAGPEMLRGVSREDGTYELLLDEPGEYYVQIQTAGETAYGGNRRANVPDVDVYSFDLDLGGVRLTGTVFEEETEAPVAGANVSVRASERKPAEGFGSTTTRSDGGFEIDLEPGSYTLGVNAEGYGPSKMEITVGESSPPDLRIALKKGREIRGTVVDETGRGVPNLMLFATTGEESLAGRGFGRTLADGSFLISGLAAGTYNLLVGSGRGMFAFAPGVRPGQEDITLTLQPGGKAVFTVRDVAGNPVEGAGVGLSAIGGVPVFGAGVGAGTDAAGRAEVELPAGLVEVTIRKDEQKTKLTVNIRAGAPVPVEVVLQLQKMR